jgi:hypothetical protein
VAINFPARRNELRQKKAPSGQLRFLLGGNTIS